MKRLCLLLAALTTLLLTSTFASATAVSGSLPFVFIDVTGTGGSDLSTITMLSATNSITESPGTGDFAAVPVLTNFGPMSLSEATIGTGGGFAVTNATWGTFTADSATLITRIPSFLNIDMHGVFVPGPGLPGLTSSNADAHVTFNMTGPALSGAFTLETTAPVSEPATLTLLGCGGLLFGIAGIRKKLERPTPPAGRLCFTSAPAVPVPVHRPEATC